MYILHADLFPTLPDSITNICFGDNEGMLWLLCAKPSQAVKTILCLLLEGQVDQVVESAGSKNTTRPLTPDFRRCVV